ncbi:putative plectin-like protein [Trypanosoma cruzi]|nr:plectin-like protein [Trypanosoma cruzi cruzi]RNF22544.1 putative plectin-like protein [Trypanosoma cruzi]
MLEQRIISVERRSAAMERAIIAAMEEVDELRSLFLTRIDGIQRVDALENTAKEGRDDTPAKSKKGDLASLPKKPRVGAVGERKEKGKSGRGGEWYNTPCSELTLRHLEEVMQLATEAIAASAAQKEKSHLHEVRQSALEKEVEALHSQLERRTQGVEQHTSQQVQEMEMKLRKLETKMQQQREELIEEALKRLHGFREASPLEGGGGEELIQRLQERVSQLELKQEALRSLVATELDAVMEDRVKSIAESHLQQLLREQQQQQQWLKGGITVNTSTQETTAKNGVASAAAIDPLPAAAGPLDFRSLRLDVDVLRQDLVRSIVEIEKVMDQQQRLGVRVHSCVSTVQRHQTDIDGLSDQQKTLIQSHMARLETQQATATARQEKHLAAELDLLHAKVLSEVRRVHEQQTDMIVRSEHQRLDDLAAAQERLRDELRVAVEKQREEVRMAIEQVSETGRRLERELASQLRGETARQIDAARQAQEVFTDETQRLLQDTQEELRRMQNNLKDSAILMQERSRRFEESIENRLNDEARRIKTFTNDATLRLQKQVEDEVRRLVHITEQESLSSMQHEMQRVNVALQALEEEQRALREGMLMLSAPSRTMASLDHRMNVLQEDVRSMFAQIVHVQDIGAPGLTKHVLAKQQRMLQDDILEVKSRLRRCEECCGYTNVVPQTQEMELSHTLSGKAFPHITVTQPTKLTTESLTPGKPTLGQASDVAAGVVQSPGVPYGLNQSELMKGTSEINPFSSTFYDPLAGVFD